MVDPGTDKKLWNRLYKKKGKKHRKRVAAAAYLLACRCLALQERVEHLECNMTRFYNDYREVGG